MARPIKPAHTAIVFDPYAAIELFEARGASGGQKFVLMAPILAPELHRAWNAKAAGAGDCASQEGDELVLGHLADRHRELAMRQAGALADEAGDLHVVGRVGEGNLSEFLANERRVKASAQRIRCGPTRQRSPGRVTAAPVRSIG